jgi:hypothetical protein
VRIVGRSQAPFYALLLLAPSIPELLTGSTPISRLFYDPLGFLLSFSLDVGLYGTGALLIREFCVAYRRGWASVLLLGAAYGIAEEGFAVHTFFQRSGSPVGLLGTFGHAFGVNWLWALGLTIFHATYSIALPILVTQLWFPETRGERWLDRGLVALLAAIYAAEVVVFAFVVGHGPSPAALLFFLAVVVLLLVGAFYVPLRLFAPRPGPARLGRVTLWVLGSLGFLGWVGVLLLAQSGRVPAWACAVELVGVDAVVLATLVLRVGTVDLERSEFRFATGMLGVLFLWDVAVEFSVPGILGVSAVFAVLLYLLDRRITRRELAVGSSLHAVAGLGGRLP